MVRVGLPFHLRNMAGVGLEVDVDVPALITIHSILSALEATFPVLRGTIRDHDSLKRRAFLRFHACGEDISFLDPHAKLPEAVATGSEPFLVVGAIAGG